MASFNSRLQSQLETVDESFRPHYTQYILPKVQEYEALRKRAISKFKFRVLIAIPAAFAGIAALFYLMYMYPSETFINISLILGLMGGGALFYWAYYPISHYMASVKTDIYPLIFNFFGPDFLYRQKSPITVQSFKPSGIVPDYDDEKTDDYVRGKHRGVDIELLEAEMTEETGSGKHRRTVRVFKGVLVSLSANKKFKGKTIIKRDRGFMNWALKFTDLQKVSLEDPVFEKAFEVFSSDQIEARYLLTTSFMDRMLKLKTLFEGSGIEASFYDNRLLLMIATKKDYFENSSIFTPATFIPEISDVLAQMKTFFEIIETLKLDEKTGL